MTMDGKARKVFFVVALLLAAGLARGAAPDSAWRFDATFADPVTPCAEPLRVVP